MVDLLICEWAAIQPEVRRVWIFGSYAYGIPRPDSDLDVAVEIDRATIGNRSMESFWIISGVRLQGSLRLAIAPHRPGLEVNLELYHRYLGKIAYAAVSRNALSPLYKRP